MPHNDIEKYSFNSLLFSKLSDVLDISGAEIARRCGLNQQVLNRYQNGGSVLPVKVLMKLCNSLRMPARYFVSTGDNHVLPRREEATIIEEDWHPIKWSLEAAELTFGDGEGKIYWKDLAVVMGVSPEKPHEWFALKKRFPIDRFFKACNHYDISPLTFIIDENRDAGKRKHSARTEGNAGSGSVRDDIATLSRKVGDVTEAVDDLKEKYEALLKAYEQLALALNLSPSVQH